MGIKKVIPFALTAMLISGVSPATDQAFAEERASQEVTSDEKAYVKVEGTIVSVEKQQAMTLYAIKQGEETPNLAITEETLVFDNAGRKVELKKGDKVSAYTNANKPMIMIYPPQYSPDAVIVETDASSTAVVGMFDDELMDPYLQLQLNVADTTELSSLSGGDVAARDLKGHDLLVFYTMTTRSIPAQTTPEKVIVLDTKEVNAERSVEEIMADDHYMIDGVQMVPLRLVAERLGYVVDSTGVGAIVSKGARSYTVTRSQKEYGFNKSLRMFEVAPEMIEPRKTYVPVKFIEELME